MGFEKGSTIIEGVPDDDIKPEDKSDLKKYLLEGLPETEIEITQGDIQSLVDKKPSENIVDYWNKLNEVEKGILAAKARELFRTGK